MQNTENIRMLLLKLIVFDCWNGSYFALFESWNSLYIITVTDLNVIILEKS